MHERDYLEHLRELQQVAWPEGHANEPQYPLGQRPLTHYLQHWTQATLDKPAVRFYGHDLSYAELDNLSDRFATLLLDNGVQPEASAEALRDGWLHTGDSGVITEQGFIRYLGRRKEMLKVNGMSVFPSELEAMLGQHPDLLASAVIGRPDERRGEMPLAFVIAKPGSALTADSLIDWCRQIMAGYKVPEVRLVDSLPMTATGKVKKNELKELI